ncbi:MAG: DNA polymerase domain-containing protein [Bacteroidota bacterium]
MATPAPDTSDATLYGHDDTPRIVDVQPLLNRPSREQAMVRLYRRSEDGAEVFTEDALLYPFFFISDIGLLRHRRDTFRASRLQGGGFFEHVVVFSCWQDYYEAIRHVKRQTDSDQRRPEELYLISDPVQQYLTQSGRTCFKDMTLDDLHRLQLDIEVISDGSFPNAERAGDEVVIVALTDNRGWSEVLHQRSGVSEATLLRELVHTINERDPDVLEGYNVFAFDLAYLQDRCDLHNVEFAIGRDGSVPRTFDSSMRFAERTVDFPAMDIAGRHVIDAYFQVMAFDVFKRDLPDYSLKTAARYFGFAPEDRTYIAGEDLTEAWHTDRERLLDYALDDVIETGRLARHLSGSTFYLTQMLPMTYGRAARRGPAAKIESLFVREYLRQRYALPQSNWGSQSMGGYTDIFRTGVIGPVVYADVESLYPSIMLNYDIQPTGDALDLFPRLLDRLTTLRLDTKSAMRSAEDEEVQSELDARQSSYKILINCFDPETEIMTVEGPKNVREVSVGDRVYSLNPDTLEAEIKPVTHVHHQSMYRGEMIRLNNQHVDFLVTPNHRLLTNRVNGYRETGYQWIEAGELTQTSEAHRLPPRAARWDVVSRPSNAAHLVPADAQPGSPWIPDLRSASSGMTDRGARVAPERLTPLLTHKHRSRIDYEGSIHCVTVADNHTVLAGRNGTFNWIGQSFYGMLGFSLAAFNDFAEADRVARIGQDLVQQIIEVIRERGGTVVEVDTDGVFFVPPEDVRGADTERDFTIRLTDAMPEGIRIGFDGRYKKMLSYKKKNYALLTYEGDLKFKGSSLISRSNEPFGRTFVRRAIRRLLDHDIEGLHQLYLDTRQRIIDRTWEQGVDSFARTETLKTSVEEYEAAVEAGERPRAATYELAIQREEETGQPVRVGDRISYYITGESANVTAFKHCARAEQWDPDNDKAPNENTAYYLKRLDEFARKFTPFFREEDFDLVFSPEDLFGFSAQGIELVTKVHESKEDSETTEVPF